MPEQSTCLQVVLVVDGERQPAWVAWMIDTLRPVPWLHLHRIVQQSEESHLLRPLDGAVFRAFFDSEARHLDTEPGDPWRLVEVSWPDEQPITPGSAVDVVVCLGATTPPAGLLPRHGFWSFGPSSPRDGVLRALRNPSGDIATTRTSLCRVSRDGSSVTELSATVSRTDRGSPLVTAMHSRWKGAILLRRALERLHRDGEVTGSPATLTFEYQSPRNMEMAWLWTRRVARIAWLRALGLVLRPQWFLLCQRGQRCGPQDLDFRRFSPIEPPIDRIWADPFPVVHAGRMWVFFEEKLDSEVNGHISVAELEGAGFATPPERVLTRPHHLSYPFVFEWNGSTFMMPESHDAGRLEVFRAIDFPHHWELEAVALDEAVVDATLEKIADRWWLFAAKAAVPGMDCDELHLYHAQTPLGPWSPHPANPVVSDVRSARPAGRLFLDGDTWVRPAQDGSVRYGHALRLMRITTLTPHHYSEQEERVLPPDWRLGLQGNHTLNSTADITFIDALRRIRRYRGGPGGA